MKSGCCYDHQDGDWNTCCLKMALGENHIPVQWGGACRMLYEPAAAKGEVRAKRACSREGAHAVRACSRGAHATGIRACNRGTHEPAAGERMLYEPAGGGGTHAVHVCSRGGGHAVRACALQHEPEIGGRACYTRIQQGGARSTSLQRGGAHAERACSGRRMQRGAHAILYETTHRWYCMQRVVGRMQYQPALPVMRGNAV